MDAILSRRNGEISQQVFVTSIRTHPKISLHSFTESFTKPSSSCTWISNAEKHRIRYGICHPTVGYAGRVPTGGSAACGQPFSVPARAAAHPLRPARRRGPRQETWEHKPSPQAASDVLLARRDGVRYGASGSGLEQAYGAATPEPDAWPPRRRRGGAEVVGEVREAVTGGFRP